MRARCLEVNTWKPVTRAQSRRQLLGDAPDLFHGIFNRAAPVVRKRKADAVAKPASAREQRPGCQHDVLRPRAAEQLDGIDWFRHFHLENVAAAPQHRSRPCPWQANREPHRR